MRYSTCLSTPLPHEADPHDRGFNCSMNCRAEEELRRIVPVVTIEPYCGRGQCRFGASTIVHHHLQLRLTNKLLTGVTPFGCSSCSCKYSPLPSFILPCNIIPPAGCVLMLSLTLSRIFILMNKIVRLSTLLAFELRLVK